MGGAVYISSCQHTKKKIRKENCIVWIALEPLLNACPSDQGFPNGSGGAFPLNGGRWKIFLKENLIWWCETEEKWFWPFETFSRPKTIFCTYWTLIKIKIDLCIQRGAGGQECTGENNSEWGAEQIFGWEKHCQHVWSLISFKWARKSHPHHNMTSFLYLCGAG